MRIVWAKETKADFRRLDDFLDPISSTAAKKAAQTIRKNTLTLINNPDIGTLDDETGNRELFIPFGKRGYVVRYSPDYDASIIYILRVWHSREDRE